MTTIVGVNAPESMTHLSPPLNLNCSAKFYDKQILCLNGISGELSLIQKMFYNIIKWILKIQYFCIALENSKICFKAKTSYELVRVKNKSHKVKKTRFPRFYQPIIYFTIVNSQ